MKPNPDVRDYVTASVALAETKAANAQAVKNYASLYEIREGQNMPQRAELDSGTVPDMPVVGSDGDALHGDEGGAFYCDHAGAEGRRGGGAEGVERGGEGVSGACGGVK